MSVIWFIRWERFKWYLRLGPLWQLIERQRVRRELLALPGVDDLVRSVMDYRYGKYGWRVKDGILEAEVVTYGQGTPWWGPIGPLREIITRKWLTAVWMEMKGQRKPEPLSHAKPTPPPEWKEGDFYPGPFRPDYYQGSYADTEPLDDDGRTSK